MFPRSDLVTKTDMSRRLFVQARTELDRAIARALARFQSKSALNRSSSDDGPGFIALKKTRRVIKLSGGDARKLLQSLLTNDINEMFTSRGMNVNNNNNNNDDDDDNNEGVDLIESQQSMYAAMLTTKGRVVTDCFVYKWDQGEGRSDGEIYIDTCSSAKEELLRQIVRRKLRSAVTVDDCMDEVVVACAPPANGTSKSCTSALAADPRWFGLGKRGIVSAAKYAKKVGGNDDDDDENEIAYARWRHVNGVPEGSIELGDRFPAETRLTHLNAVSFTKGCYVGQEPTARAEFQGEVRKGIVPIVFDETKEVKINGSLISKRDEKEIGKVVASKGGGVGLALVRFAKVENVSEGVSIETVNNFGDDDDVEKKKTFIDCEFGTPHWWSHHQTKQYSKE